MKKRTSGIGMLCLRKPSCGLPERNQMSSLQISHMKNVVRETLHALIPAPGTDHSIGPAPSKIMEAHSEIKMPLPHHAITLSMSSLDREGCFKECSRVLSTACRGWCQFLRPPVPRLRKPPKTVRARI